MFAQTSRDRLIQVFALAVTLCVVAFSGCGSVAGACLPVADAETPIRSWTVATMPLTVSRDGRLKLRVDTTSVVFDAISRLEGATPEALETLVSDADSVRFRRRWESNDKQGTCFVEDLLRVQGDQVQWTVTVSGVEGTWSAPVVSEMRDYPQASLVFRVYVDAREGNQAAEAIAGESLLVQTEVMRAGEIWFLDVPLPEGTKFIRLEADDAGDGIDCDHADWANAGFVTQPPQE